MEGFKNITCDKISLGQKHKEPVGGCACSITSNSTLLLLSLLLYHNPFLFFYFMVWFSGWC